MEGLKFSPILIEYSVIKSNGIQQNLNNAGKLTYFSKVKT